MARPGAAAAAVAVVLPPLAGVDVVVRSAPASDAPLPPLPLAAPSARARASRIRFH
jgi:hypothetical protein